MPPAFPRPAATRPIPLTRIVDALEAAGLHVGLDGASTEVSGVTFDSRAVRPDDLYAALPGANVHGARFTAGALTAGAGAVLTDEAGLALVREADAEVPVLVVDEPRAALGHAAAAVYADAERREGLTLLGITGTNGKTTTAYLLDGGLRTLGRTTGLIGTVETRVAGERIKSERTTPESSDLHGLLAVMVERGVEACTMEVSSHAMVMHRVDGVTFEVAAFTNLSQDHLDFHGSMEAYYEAKASLFAPEHARRGVVVVDDEWGARLAREAGIPVTTIASRPGLEADWVVERDDASSSAFRLRRGDLALELLCPLPGDFNQVNTAVAVAMLVELGVDPAEAGAAVCHDPGVPGRMEKVVVRDDQPLAVVDFAHTPDAVAAALVALRMQVPGRLVVVLGAGGDRDRGKRPFMGATAAGLADLFVLTDDNPRSEVAADIRASVLEGVPAELRDRVVEVEGRGDAIRRAVEGLTSADAIVVLGKGHETGQEIAGTVHPFDDRDELAQALASAQPVTANEPQHAPQRPHDPQTPQPGQEGPR